MSSLYPILPHLRNKMNEEVACGSQCRMSRLWNIILGALDKQTCLKSIPRLGKLSNCLGQAVQVWSSNFPSDGEVPRGTVVTNFALSSLSSKGRKENQDHTHQVLAPILTNQVSLHNALGQRENGTDGAQECASENSVYLETTGVGESHCALIAEFNNFQYYWAFIRSVPTEIFQDGQDQNDLPTQPSSLSKWSSQTGSLQPSSDFVLLFGINNCLFFS